MIGNLIKKIQSLENENVTLKNLLKETQTELSISSQVVSDKIASSHQDKYIETLMQEITALKTFINEKNDNNISHSNAREHNEIDSLKAKLSEQEMSNLREKYASEIEHLKSRNNELNHLYETEMDEKNSKILALQGEIDQLKHSLIKSTENIQVLKLQVESSSQDAQAQSSKNDLQTEIIKLKEKIISLETEIAKIKTDYQHKLTETTQLSETKLKELELKFNKEKEETMDAAASEIEAVEKSKNDEIAALVAQLASTSLNAKTLITQLSHVAKQSNSIKSQLGYITDATKKDINDLSASMRLYVSQQVKARVKLAEESLHAMTAKYKREMTERKKLHNVIQELKGKFISICISIFIIIIIYSMRIIFFIYQSNLIYSLYIFLSNFYYRIWLH